VSIAEPQSFPGLIKVSPDGRYFIDSRDAGDIGLIAQADELDGAEIVIKTEK
jgi:hypothetical protein